MGSIVRPLMIVAAIAVNVIPGVGQVLSATMISAITMAGVGAAIGLATQALGMGPKAPSISTGNKDRLLANIDPSTPRKIVFGETALGIDIRYHEWSAISDEEQAILHRVYAAASHKVQSFDEIWFDDRLAWSATGGVTSHYQHDEGHYLAIQTRTEGSSANTISINGGAKWGSTRRLTGCAYWYAAFRVYSFQPKKEPMDSPFSGSIPSRITVRGKGALVYDPRLDSTVGGSGSMRADNQSTWAYSASGIDIGRNPALQLLWYLIGWRINGKLVCGRGIPPSRINMQSFIDAANICDETVTSSVHGTEPRYRSDGIFTEADDPTAVLDTLKAAMSAELSDIGGVFSIHVRRNDLATVAVQLTDDDVLSGYLWKQTSDLESSINLVRGRFVDPSNESLYQLIDYPEQELESPDDIERAEPFDLPTVQSVSQAQRLAKMRLARAQYRGQFAADFSARAWAASKGKIVELSFSLLGWNNKKFRVLEMGIRADGVVPMVLQEEHPDIYLWDNSDVPAVQPVEPTIYDPRYAPMRRLLDSIEPGATRNVYRGIWTPGEAYVIGDLFEYEGTLWRVIEDHVADADFPPPNEFVEEWFGVGSDGLYAALTNPAATVPATFEGEVTSYTGASGRWEIKVGETDITSLFTITTDTDGNPGSLDVNYVQPSDGYSGPHYAVVGSFDEEDDIADLTMKATGSGAYAAVHFIRAFRLNKQRAPQEDDATPPATPSGLVLSSVRETDTDGTQKVTLVANWTANGEADLNHYVLPLRKSGGNFVNHLFAAGQTEARFPVLGGEVWEARLQAVDHSGNVSNTYPTPPAVISHTTVSDGSAPAAPTSFTATAGVRLIYLKWVNASADDLHHVDIYENTTNNSGTATQVASVLAEAGKDGFTSRGGLATGVTRYYWLKSVDTSGNASGFSSGVSATTSAVGNDDILTGSLYANRVFVSGNATQDALPTGITVGVSGTTIGEINTRAADPVARANTQSTKILPGLVQISGATTIADWRYGPDQTKIDGGDIGANSVKANSVEVGLRGIIVEGLEFEHNSPAPNRASWTPGTISYFDDSGADVSYGVGAGDISSAVTSGVRYIYWVKDTTVLSVTSVRATAFGANNVVLATYRGGTDLVATYGRTIIDGSGIKTGTVEADRLNVTSLSAVSAVMGLVRTATSGARIEYDSNQLRIYYASGNLCLRAGVW